jgi:hypothetical protein
MADTMPPEVRAKHDERMMWIGWVCNQWSYLEYIIFCAIRKMLKLDLETAKIVLGGLDIRPRVAMATELAQKQRRPAVKKALSDIGKALDNGLLKRRNRAIHGIQFIYETGEMHVEIHRGRDRGRRPLTSDDLGRLSGEIEALTRDLNDRLNLLLWKKKTPAWSLYETPSPRSPKRSTPKPDRTPELSPPDRPKGRRKAPKES